MFKIKLHVITVLLLSICLWTSKGHADEMWGSGTPALNKIVPVQIKIVINENGKENKSYIFNFNATDGQGVTYSGVITLPYSVSAENDKIVHETKFIELKNDFVITASKTETNTTINSKISMSIDITAPNNNIPIVSHFNYAGVSLHQKAETIKVFSGPLMDLSHSVDIYVKLSD